MRLYEQLAQLDASLFAELEKGDAFDEAHFEAQLAQRANWLAQLIKQSDVTAAESEALILRSQQLKDAAEQFQQRLGEQLKQMNKGRRSVKAYQSVKRN